LPPVFRSVIVSVVEPLFKPPENFTKGVPGGVLQVVTPDAPDTLAPDRFSIRR